MFASAAKTAFFTDLPSLSTTKSLHILLQKKYSPKYPEINTYRLLFFCNVRMPILLMPPEAQELPKSVLLTMCQPFSKRMSLVLQFWVRKTVGSFEHLDSILGVKILNADEQQSFNH